MSLLSAWQISMVAALNQMAHMIIPAVNVRSADVADDAVRALAARPDCARTVMGHVFMMISPLAAPAGPAFARACKLGDTRGIRCDEDHRTVDF
jgi:hypothetical protein